MELLDCVAAKFHEEPGVFKLLVGGADKRDGQTDGQTDILYFLSSPRLLTLLWHYSEWTSVGVVSLLTDSRSWRRCYPGCRRSQRVCLI